MTLTELRYIVALAQEGNFSRAAESCSVSQPTLSVAIARLEDELGVQLFERGKGFVSPSYSISLLRPFHIRGYHPLWPHFPERSIKVKEA